MSFRSKWHPDDLPGVIRKDYGHGIQSGSSKSRSDKRDRSSESNPQERYPKHQAADEEDPSKAENAVKFLTHLGVQKDVLSELPEELLQLFEYKYCRLCNFICKTDTFRKWHYLSKAHRHKTRTWLLERKKDPCATSLISDSGQLKTSLPRDMYCELCDVHITSPAMFESHYTGSRHQKIILRQKEPRNDALNLPANRDRLDLLIERELTVLDVNRFEETKSVVLKTDSGSGYVSPKFWCDICKVAPLTEEQLIFHKNGKKHLAKEKEHILRITRCKDEPKHLTIKDRCKLLENIRCEVEDYPKETQGNGAKEDNIVLEDGHIKEENYTDLIENSQEAEDTYEIEFGKSTESGNSITGGDQRNSDLEPQMVESAEAEKDTGNVERVLATVDNAATHNVDNQNLLLLPRDAYCELCDVEMTSTYHYQSHYSGTKHRRTVLRWKQPRNIELLQPENITRLNQLIKRESLMLGLPNAENGVGIAPPREELKPENEDVSRDLYCSVCKVNPLTMEQMDSHLSGKKHLAKVEAKANETKDKTANPASRKRVAIPLHHKDIPLHDEHIPLHDKHIPLHDKHIPLHHKDIPYRENGKFVSSDQSTENQLPVLNNGLENTEDDDDYFERLCEDIDATRTIERLLNNSNTGQRMETSASPQDPPRTPRFNPKQPKFRKLELYKYVSSSDDSDMDVDSS